MDKGKVFGMAEHLRELKEQKKSYEAKIKELNEEIDCFDEELSEIMAEEELDKFSYKGHTFYLNSRLFASPASGRKEEMIEAMKSNGYGDLVTETVNANTLSSFIREHRDLTGEEVPAWLGDTVSVYEKISVGIRKG